MKSRWQEFKSIFTNKKVLTAIFVTLAILILFRIGSILPMPYIRLSDQLLNNTSSNNSTFFDMMNLLGGGGLSRISIFAIGISPYITAQIIMQLLSTELIPPLARMVKSGERGRKKIEIITRIVTLPIAAIQAYAILTMVTSNTAQDGSQLVTFASSMTFEQFSPTFYFFFIALMLSGTYISIFLGDLITKRGVGNGMTLIILAGILSSFFNSFGIVFAAFKDISTTNPVIVQVIAFMVYVVFYILLLLAVVFINGSVRKIPIQQIGQTLSKNPEELSYLPIKINAVGVIPVIFASSIMTIPSTISQFLDQTSSSAIVINNYFSLNSYTGILLYFLLIILFTFFYSYVQLNPQKISDDFKKSGRFIPGIKVGNDTEKHIGKIIFRVNWIGAPFLGIIATLPYLISCIWPIIPSNAALGGTGIVIIVSATVEVWQSIKSTATTTNYQYKRKEIEQGLFDSSSESKLW
ncbi:MAG: preprotein translocase subunit SecY [Ureaplasma sp.]|nr:preprotein translocase subunit SecY [Ureaplasma sp.]